MLSAPTLSRLASLAAFLNTAPGLRGGQPADERFTAATQLPSLVPELQEDEVRLRLAALAPGAPGQPIEDVVDLRVGEGVADRQTDGSVTGARHQAGSR